MSRQRCLPVAPTVEHREVIVVTYCTGEGTEREPAHTHTAVYLLNGTLLVNECSLSHGSERMKP